MVTGYFAFLDNRQGSSGSDYLAVVSELIGEARVKKEDQVGWKNLQVDDPLFMGDSVVTMDNSYIKIDFSAGSSLNLTPNSFLYMQKGEKTIDLDLQKGFLGLNIDSVKNKVAVNIGNEKIEIRGNQAKLHLTKDTELKTNVTVIDGTASLTFKGNEIGIKKGERLKIDPKTAKYEIRTLGISPRRPEMDRIIFKGDGENIDLAWDSSESLEEFNLTTAKDPQMRDVVSRVVTKENNAALDLNEEGKYYWQVTGSKENKIAAEAPVYSFELKKTSTPFLIYPGNNLRINLRSTEDAKDVTLRWDGQGQKNFEIEFFKYGVTKDKGEILLSTQNFLSVSGLGPQEYKWRVRTVLKGSTFSPWSDFRNFTVSDDVIDAAGQGAKGPRRRREVFDDQSGEWKRK